MDLEEELKNGTTTDLLAARLPLDKLFKSKHEDCVFKARSCALRHGRTKAVR